MALAPARNARPHASRRSSAPERGASSGGGHSGLRLGRGRSGNHAACPSFRPWQAPDRPCEEVKPWGYRLGQPNRIAVASQHSGTGPRSSAAKAGTGSGLRFLAACSPKYKLRMCFSPCDCMKAYSPSCGQVSSYCYICQLKICAENIRNIIGLSAEPVRDFHGVHAGRANPEACKDLDTLDSGPNRPDGEQPSMRRFHRHAPLRPTVARTDRPRRSALRRDTADARQKAG